MLSAVPRVNFEPKSTRRKHAPGAMHVTQPPLRDVTTQEIVRKSGQEIAGNRDIPILFGTAGAPRQYGRAKVRTGPVSG